MSNVSTLQSSKQDNTLIYLDEHRIYLYIPYHTIIVSVAKETSDFQNKMYDIFGEYKVQDSDLAPLYMYHVGGIIADIKVYRLFLISIYLIPIVIYHKQKTYH